jgi:hypothetical protein
MAPGGTQAASLYVGVGVQGDDTTKSKLQSVSALVDKLDNASSQLLITGDASSYQRVADEVMAEAKRLDAADPKLTILADGTPADTAIGHVKYEAQALEKHRTKVVIDADDKPATRVISGLKGKLESLLHMPSLGGGGGGKGGGGLGGLIGTGIQGALTMKGGGGIGGAASMLGSGLSAGALGIGGGVMAAGVVGVASLMKAGEMERYQTQLEVFLGSADKAKTRLAELTNFAKTTPFELPQVVQASKTLEVFTKGALSTGKGLQLVGDVAAGTGSDFQETAMWFGRMYDAMQSGRPFGEATMRLQEMGAISGADREKIEGLAGAVKDGKMTMVDAWGQATTSFSRFSGMMDKQSSTLEGKLSNFSDAVGQGLASVGTAMLPFAKGFIDVAIPAATLFFGVLAGGLGIIGDVVGAVSHLGDVVAFIASPLGNLNDVIGQLGHDTSVATHNMEMDISGVADAAIKAAAKEGTAADRHEGAMNAMAQASTTSSNTVQDAIDAIAAKERTLLSQSRTSFQGMATAFKTAEADMESTVNQALDSIYGPQERAIRLLQIKAEIADQKKILSDKHSTAEAKLGARARIIELQKEQASLGIYVDAVDKGGKNIAGDLSKITTGWSKMSTSAKADAAKAIAALITLYNQTHKDYGVDVNVRVSGARSALSFEAGARNASGGLMLAHSTSWVGEHGPELISTGDAAARVYSHNASTAMGGGGGGPVNISLSFPSVAPYSPGQMEQLARTIGPLLVPYLQGRGYEPASVRG